MPSIDSTTAEVAHEAAEPQMPMLAAKHICAA